MADRFGHSEQAYGSEVFNQQDPAFKTGLDNAGFKDHSDASTGSTINETYGAGSSGKQEGRFGGSTPVYKAGTAQQFDGRMKSHDDPGSLKTPAGTNAGSKGRRK